MSKKYIITIKSEYEDTTMGIMVLGARDSNLFVDTVKLDDLEELNSDYINEHFGQLQDDAYQKGFEDGKWKSEDGCTGCEWEGTPFDACERCCNNYKNMWQAKSDKIEVGDEVKPSYSDIAGVVTLVDGDTIYVLWRDGSSTSIIKLKDLCKTGRHFDIASILEDMRHD